MGNRVMKVLKNKGTIENGEMEVVENQGTLENREMEVVENQGTIENREMEVVENQGTIENQEIQVVENQGTIQNREMEAVGNQRTMENQEMEGECIEMSSTPINTVSSGVDDSNENDNRASRALNREEVILRGGREFFFLTIPGVIRLIQIFLSGLHLGSFGFLSTYYSSPKPDLIVTPFYMSAIREVFFMLVNFHTFVSAVSIIVASVMSVKSHTSLLGSLFVFVYDFVQFLMVISSSVSLLLLYSEADSKKVFGQSIQMRQGLSITGMLLACIHLIGAIYDLGIYIRRLDARIIEP